MFAPAIFFFNLFYPNPGLSVFLDVCRTRNAPDLNLWQNAHYFLVVTSSPVLEPTCKVREIKLSTIDFELSTGLVHPFNIKVSGIDIHSYSNQ